MPEPKCCKLFLYIYVKFSKVSDKKAQEFRHINIYSIANVTSAPFIAPIPKIIVIKVTKVAILQLESVRYQQTQSIGIHDVHLFNTELAMHCRAIFNCGYFRLF